MSGGVAPSRMGRIIPFTKRNENVRPVGRVGFGTVLAALVVVYAVIVAFDSSPLGRPVPVLGLTVALLVVARRRRRLGPAVWLVAAALTAAAVAAFLGASRVATALTAAATLAMATATMVLVAAVVWRRRVVDRQTVAGALAVYLLLALLFTMLHQLLAAVLGGRYATGVDGPADTAGFLYFSVVTMTTVGFGDITPASAAARAVTMSEALVGQLYLVAVVGAVVGNLSASGRRGRPAQTTAIPPHSAATDAEPGHRPADEETP